jgi:diguanylate cyclase
VVNLLVAGTVARLVRAAERAEIDGVTGLLNRRGFDRLLEGALTRAHDADEPFTVGYLDLDHFRRLNETEGHATGDRVLQDIARMWSDLIPDDARLAHGGSGEFSVLLPGRGGAESGHVIEELRQTLPHLGTASAGLAEWMPDDTKSLLLSRVDASLYRAKRAGRNRIDPRVGIDVSVREMREALGSDCFRVLYQPIVDLTNEVTVGAEALVRWQHPLRGLLNPADFIPLAEESGVIVDLGRFVLEEACRTAAQGRRQGRTLETLTVNVSGVQLHQPGYARDVLSVLRRSGWEPGRLVLEVTESSLAAEDDAAVAALADLRAAGIRIAIDDFGTGYSSLSRLAHLPVDILKIDRSFVSSIVPGRPAPIIASITALAQALGLSTVAEGVEHHDQAAVLAQHGCDRGQGWLYGRPTALQTLPLPTAGDAVVPAARRAPSEYPPSS